MASASLHGWRTRLYYLSRNPRVLAMVCAGMLVLACGIGALMPRDDRSGDLTVGDELGRTLAVADTPRLLAQWLEAVTEDLPDVAASLHAPLPTLREFDATGRIFGLDLRSAIKKRVMAQDSQALFEDFTRARLAGQSDGGKAAWEHVKSAALRVPPPRLANEFLGCLLEQADMPMEAVNAYRREGEFPDAVNARSLALGLIIELKDARTLREVLADARYRREISGWHEQEAGALLGDTWMRLRGLARSDLEQMNWGRLVCTLLAALLWCAILLRFLREVRWPWLWLVPPVLLGVVSVVPTLWIAHYQLHALNLDETGDLVGDALFYLFGVGLREELSKLAAFALLLPFLLRRRSESAALLAGAFVGLGFALEENLGYYADGYQAVVSRLLTANFMHAAMTAITGHALYVVVRSNFVRVQFFLVSFATVVAAHAIYDWSIGAESAHELLEGTGMISIIVLALLAQRFFDELASLAPPQRGLVSMVFLFLVGTVGLMGLAIVLTAAQGGALSALTLIGLDVVGNAVILIFYIRKFADM